MNFRPQYNLSMLNTALCPNGVKGAQKCARQAISFDHKQRVDNVKLCQIDIAISKNIKSMQSCSIFCLVK